MYYAETHYHTSGSPKNKFSARDLGFCLQCDGRPKPADSMSPTVLKRDSAIDKIERAKETDDGHGVGIKTARCGDVIRENIKRNFITDDQSLLSLFVSKQRLEYHTNFGR